MVERAESGRITDICLASAEYCYKLETTAIANQQFTSANLRLRAEERAQEEFLVEQIKNELRLREVPPEGMEVIDTPIEGLPPLFPVFPSKPRELCDFYKASFPEKILILDICWAAQQRYREWTRWIGGHLKETSKPAKAFRAVLTSGKRPQEYKQEPRPNNWK
jgi:hypothetical protein